jgi:hypothetical protein
MDVVYPRVFVSIEYLPVRLVGETCVVHGDCATFSCATIIAGVYSDDAGIGGTQVCARWRPRTTPYCAPRAVHAIDAPVRRTRSPDGAGARWRAARRRIHKGVVFLRAGVPGVCRGPRVHASAFARPVAAAAVPVQAGGHFVGGIFSLKWALQVGGGVHGELVHCGRPRARKRAWRRIITGRGGAACAQ